MAFNLVQIGDKIDIKVQFKNNSEVAYASMIVGILDEEDYVLSIHRPMRNDEVLEMFQDKEYNVTAYSGDAMLVFKAYFEGFVKQEDEVLLALRLSKDGYKIQRREFFRFSCSIPMRFRVMDFDEGDIVKEGFFKAGLGDVLEGEVKDIGGGGLRFITESNLNMDYRLECVFPLGNTEITLVGLILEKQYLPKTVQSYQYRIIFIDIEKEFQDEIIGFIFTQQRKLRRSGGI